MTLGIWFYGGALPLGVTTLVDEHSITVARYPRGPSKFETHWGTFTDPWTWQPQPKCGLVTVSAEGTIQFA